MKKFLESIGEILDLYPLIYSFLQSMRIENNELVDTVDVDHINDFTGWRVLVNTDRFGRLPLKTRVGEIIHSLLHVVYKHPLIYSEDKYPNLDAFNCACDLVINQKMPREYHPLHFCLPKDYSLKESESLDYYYNCLGEHFKTDKFPHYWSVHKKEMNDSDFSFIESSAARYSNTVIGSGCENKLETIILNDLSINFDERRFINGIVSFLKDSNVVFDKQQTWAKRSRRFPNLLPGRRYKEAKKGIIYCDTSGSIQEDELIVFLKIINKIIKNTNIKVEIKLFNDGIYKVLPAGGNIKRLEFKKGGTRIDDVVIDMARNKGGIFFILSDCLYSVDKKLKIARNTNLCWLISKPQGKDHKLKEMGRNIEVFSLIK